MPIGNVCCHDNAHNCPSGHICTQGLKCLAKTSPSYCGGNRYCDNGICIKDGRCLSPSSIRVCSNLTYCDEGFICTNHNKCLSIYSKSYCGGTKYCEDDKVCVSGGTCLARDNPRVCSDLSVCREGAVCQNNSCLGATDPRYCGGRSFCSVGEACVDNGTHCIPTSSPRYCGERHYCAPGLVCDGVFRCKGGTAAPSPAPVAPPQGQPASASCLNIVDNGEIAALGECQTPNGRKAHWKMTRVTSTQATGCPKEIDFVYYDPDAKSSVSASTPFSIQTCGDPPTGIRRK